MVRPGSGAGHGPLRVLVGRTDRLGRPFGVRTARLGAPALRGDGGGIGNVVVPEDRIRAALESATTYEELREGLDLALGQAWDDELESFRHAGAGAPVRWLNNRVG